MIDIILDIATISLSLYWFGSYIGLFLVAVLSVYPIVMNWEKIVGSDNWKDRLSTLNANLLFVSIVRVMFIALMVIKHMHII